MVAHPEAVLAHDGGARLPKHRAPDFALGMHLSGGERAESVERTARNAWMLADLRGIDILERQRILGQVRRVGIAANAEIVILGQRGESIRHVTAKGIGRVQLIRGLAQERQRIEVRPAFTHARRLRGADAHATTDESCAESVNIFVEHNLGIEIAIHIGRRAAPDEHLNAPGLAVRGRSEVRVVEARAVLRVGDDRVVPETAAAEVILLIVARCLIEAELVEPVVHPVAPIEQLHGRRIAVSRRIVREIQWRVEHAERRALRTRQIRHVITVAIRMRIHVVAARFVLAVTDPANRRGVRVQRAEGDKRSRHEGRLVGVRCLPAR